MLFDTKDFRRHFHLLLNDHVLRGMLRVTPIPQLSDNYCWRVANIVHKTAVLVDPAEGAIALDKHKQLSKDDDCELVGVLATHYHPDHTGGNVYLAQTVPGISIVGGAAENGRIPSVTRLVSDGDTVSLPGFTFKALHTPCHTRGHICYHTTEEVQLMPVGGSLSTAGADAEHPSIHQSPAPGLYPGAVFTGDTLFSGGCGRFFEGTAPQMASALSRLGALPDRTLVYAGHEYTAANLRFGLHVDERNADVLRRLAECEQLRAAGLPTLPSTVEQERRINVFMRAIVADEGPGSASFALKHNPIVLAECEPGTGAPDGVAVLAALRQAKNAFKA